MNYWRSVKVESNKFLYATRTVTVTDGRLTLDQGTAHDKATRINYVEISPLKANRSRPADPDDPNLRGIEERGVLPQERVAIRPRGSGMGEGRRG